MRNDTGVFEGGEISIYYDPMIAKLVTHASDRTAAIDAQANALDAFFIDGIRHNIPFLSALMRHPRWREGRLSTGFIAEEFPNGFAPQPANSKIGQIIAAIAAHVDHVMNTRKRQISGQLRAPSRLVFDLKRVVVFGAKQVKLEVRPRRDGIDVIFEDGARLRVDLPWTPGHAVWRGEIDETPVSAQLRLILNGFEIAHGGAQIAARVFTEPEAEFAGLMLEKEERGQFQGASLPDAGSGQDDRGSRRARGKGGRAAMHGRSHENGECAAGGA